MASIDPQGLNISPRRPTAFPWPSRPKPTLPFPLKTPAKRRKKLPSVRLGGQRRKGRRIFLLGLLKRLRIRWLRLKYSYLLKKLKSLYSSVVRDLAETGASLEEIQKRIMVGSYFDVPVIGLGVAGVPSHVERRYARGGGASSDFIVR